MISKTKLLTILIIILAIGVQYSKTQQVQLNRQLDKPVVIPPKKKKKTTTGGFSSGIFGFVIGPIIFVMSFVGTWFNEKRAAVNYKRLKLVGSLLKNQAPQYNLDDLNNHLNNQKRLVYRTGNSEIISPAKDVQCGVFPYDAIVLKRQVEVKQIRSQAKRRSDEQEIQYKLQWVSENIQDCEGQYNPSSKWFIKNQEFFAPEVKVCNYLLNNSQMDQLQCDTEINPQPEIINTVSNIALNTGNPSQPIVLNNYIYFPAYSGDVQSRGSLRVKFRYCKSTQLSIISGTNNYNQVYQPFRIDLVDNKGSQDQPPCQEAQCCICCTKLAQLLVPMTQINLIMKGNYDAKQMISLSIRKNLNQTNILRLVFFLSMVIGICIFFSPITTLLGYIPLVGGFLQGTAALIVLLGALLVSIPLFGITFGLAWLRYRPMIGGSVLAVAIIMLIVFSTTKG